MTSTLRDRVQERWISSLKVALRLNLKSTKPRVCSWLEVGHDLRLAGRPQLPNSLNILAPDCGSWSSVSRGTSLRTKLNPLGRQGLAFVHRANGMISRPGFVKDLWTCCRLVLLILLIVSCHSIFCVEQPRGSEQVLPRHPRFEWLTNQILYDSWRVLALCPLLGVAYELLHGSLWS